MQGVNISISGGLVVSKVIKGIPNQCKDRVSRHLPDIQVVRK